MTVEEKKKRHAEAVARYRARNKEKIQDYNQDYRGRNREQLRIQSQTRGVEFRQQHPEKMKAARDAWRKRNLAHLRGLNAKRYAAQMRRMPGFADADAIRMIYEQAAKQGLEVDHVIPLQGRKVSGLHVHNNLQLLSREENTKKGNRYVV